MDGWPFGRVTARVVGLLAVWILAAPVLAGAASAPPRALDCSHMPCDAVLPDAVRFRAVEGADYAEGLDAADGVVGWVALSTDWVDIKAYSGKPLVTLVGLRPDGTMGGARVIHHSEPILLVGIPESALHEFVEFYRGKSALQRIVIGRPSHEDVVSVDAISGATVTVLAQNQTVLATARALGRAVGVFEPGQLRIGHFVASDEVWSFERMLAEGVLSRMVVTETELGTGTGTEPAVDLYFGIADAPQVGRALLGANDYAYYTGRLADGEHMLVVFNGGDYSFKGSAFVRGGVFDRIRLQQGLREITFRDTDYENLPEAAAQDAPPFEEGGLFFVRGGQLDPGAPFDLVFLGSHYDRRGAFTREFREFTAPYQLPESVYVVEHQSDGIPWRQAWLNRRVEVVVLCLYLAAVVGIFALRRYTTADPDRIRRLHLASLALGFVVLGVLFSAQPSVTQILTAVGALVESWRWELFLSEPLIFLLWIFIFAVSVSWGRGVFCGWVCPYGAMTELAFKIGERLGIRGYELPDSVHRPLRLLRYGILGVLVLVFLFDSLLAERLAEVEPFKSTFLVPFWTRAPGYGVWWGVLLVASVFAYRPFCRYLCPLGAGLALLGSFRFSGPRRRVFCSKCTICTRGCEPRAIRPDGTIDPRECLSCMDCEATYRNPNVCPPLIGIERLKIHETLSPHDRERLARLREEAVDA